MMGKVWNISAALLRKDVVHVLHGRLLSSEKKPPGGGADALRLTSPGLANVTTQNMFLTQIVDARMHQEKGGACTIYVATDDVPWEAERNAQGDNKGGYSRGGLAWTCRS